jgi:Effector-associated domain 1
VQLSGRQFEEFTRALIDAYSLQRLREVLRFRLDKNLDAIALGDDLTAIVFRVIDTAEREGWTDRLLLAARESNPGNPGLLAFAQAFGLAPATPPRPELERLIKTSNSFLDIARWRQRLGEIEAQVCRVEAAGAFGTVQLVSDLETSLPEPPPTFPTGHCRLPRRDCCARPNRP